MGKYIAEHLLKTGKHGVTASARPSSTSKLPEGVQVVRIDYSGDADAALVEALLGQQVLVVTISKLVSAATKTGVPYILPNWFGHDATNEKLCNDSLLSHNRDSICAEIESLGISSYLLLLCNLWYEFTLAGGPDRYGLDSKQRSFVLSDDDNVAYQNQYLALVRRSHRKCAESEGAPGPRDSHVAHAVAVPQRLNLHIELPI